MRSNLLSFERRARAAATLVLLGTTLTPPTTASSIVRPSNTGALVWRTGATGNPFKFPGGAKFEIVGPQNAKWTLTDNVLPDTDPTAGKFQLTSLSPGSFTVVVRDDGTALVTAEYERIIGSHWLALVDAASVPEGL